MQKFVLAILILTFAGYSTANATPPIADFPQPGISYGGKVRSGPGLQYRQTGSLREGDHIRIMSGTGVMMNGYEWFQIRYRKGFSGYQWGGLMCSQKPHSTISQVCGERQSPVSNTVPSPVPPLTVDGTNVVQVDYPGGAFRQTGWRNWQETDAQGRVRFVFSEKSRDDRSVFLFDISRNITVQLDLHRQKILIGLGQRPNTDLYDIIHATANPTVQPEQADRPNQTPHGIGHSVAKILHPGGKYTNVGNGRWQEATHQGHVIHQFREQRRDDWSVYLFDSTRNLSLQFDLRRKKIMIGVGNGPQTDLHDITSYAVGH